MKRSLLLVLMFFGTLLTALAQSTVTGIIKDDVGLPLTGATVTLKGTTTGAVADIDGKYSIKVPNAEVVLVFKFVGMIDQEVTVGTQSVIDVVLKSDELLDEVVVSAFGIKKDKDKLGYSAQVVGGDAISNSGQNNVVNALNGKVAGVNIISSSGAPGAPADIKIRGISSISGNNQPLFVVDGVPINNTTDASNASGTTTADYGQAIGTNRASDLNPNDIESVTVLKGGAATALYGLRATNGAIIITTKSGGNTNGGLNISFGTGFSVEKVNKYPSFTHNFARGRNGDYSNVTHWSWGPAYASNPTFPATTSLDLDGDGAMDDVTGQAIPRYIDNYKNFWQTGHTYTTNVSVSGGTDKSTFYSSIAYNSQEGIIPNSLYERLNFTVKANFDVSDRLTVGGFASYANVNTRTHQGANNGFGQGLGYWHHMWDISDSRPWVGPTGDRTWFSDFVPDPRWIAYQEAEEGKVDRFIGNFNFNYEISKYLNLRYRIGVDTYGDNKDLLRPITSPNTTNRDGDFYEIRINSRDVTSNVSLYGSVDLNNDMTLNYLVGNEIYEQNYDRLYTFGEGLAIQGFRDISNASLVTARNTVNRKRIVGVFGELSWSYKDMFFLTATARNDWSSTLPVNNNSIFYPSISGGFVVTEALENAGPLSFLKLNGSFAQVGNDAPIYVTTDRYVNPVGINVNNGNIPRFTISTTQGNPNIRPELSNAFEFGFESRLLDDIIGLDFTFYRRTTQDQIIPVLLAPETGFTGAIKNVGEVRNQGIEAVLSFNDILRNKSEKIRWDAFFNFTRNRNEVISLEDGVEEVTIGNSYWNGARVVAKTGYPLGTIIGQGFKRNENGELLIDDNGYPVTAENLILGDPYPDFTLAWNNTVSYKGLSLSFTIERKQGGELLNDAEAFWVYSGLSATTANRYYDATDVNASATRVFDGIVESTGQRNTQSVILDNTYYHNYNSFLDEPHMEDASWFRLRTVSLTYSIPKSVFSKVSFIKGLDVTFTGRNLWLKTDYSGIDPETNALGAGNIQGIDVINAPNTKSYGFSLRARF